MYFVSKTTNISKISLISTKELLIRSSKSTIQKNVINNSISISNWRSYSTDQHQTLKILKMKNSERNNSIELNQRTISCLNNQSNSSSSFENSISKKQHYSSSLFSNSLFSINNKRSFSRYMRVPKEVLSKYKTKDTTKKPIVEKNSSTTKEMNNKNNNDQPQTLKHEETEEALAAKLGMENLLKDLPEHMQHVHKHWDWQRDDMVREAARIMMSKSWIEYDNEMNKTLDHINSAFTKRMQTEPLTKEALAQFRKVKEDAVVNIKQKHKELKEKRIAAGENILEPARKPKIPKVSYLPPPSGNNKKK